MQRILVIEDENDIRQLLRFNLEREGFAVLEAADGLGGLHMATSELPDLVVLDLMLPGMDGCDVCRRLKAQPVTAAIPVLMLTARGEEVDRIVGLTLGADDYVVKPFSVRELVLRIRAILRRGSRPGMGSALCRGALLLDVEAHRGAGSGPDGHGVPSAGRPHAACGRRAHPRTAAQCGLGIFVRRLCPYGGHACAPSAGQTG